MSNFQRLTGHCRTCLNLYSQRLTVRRGDAGFNWLSSATLTHEAIYIVDSKLADCCHCAPNVCGDCLCFRSDENTMPVKSPMLVTRVAMSASHPVNATMILPSSHTTRHPGHVPLAPAPLNHCLRSNFLPYSHCSGGGTFYMEGVFII